MPSGLPVNSILPIAAPRGGKARHGLYPRREGGARNGRARSRTPTMDSEDPCALQLHYAPAMPLDGIEPSAAGAPPPPPPRGRQGGEKEMRCRLDPLELGHGEEVPVRVLEPGDLRAVVGGPDSQLVLREEAEPLEGDALFAETPNRAAD